MKTLAQALQAQTLSHIKMCLVFFANPAAVIYKSCDFMAT